MTEALRLACIIYTITIRLAFGILITRAATQLSKLKVIMETREETGKYNLWEEAGLGWVKGWMLAIGLVASEKRPAEREWFQTRFEGALTNMGWRMEEF